MRVCQVCKNEYPKKPKSTHTEYAASRFCSRPCKWVFDSVRMKGNKYGKGFFGRHSAQTKRLISEKKLANPTRYWQDKTRSPATVAKMSAFAKTRKGELSPRWLHDRTALKSSDRQSGHKYRIWRESVFIRDSNRCQVADDTCGGQLEAHHLLPWKLFPSFRYDIRNGITLCHKHHPRQRFLEELFAEELARSGVLTG